MDSPKQNTNTQSKNKSNNKQKSDFCWIKFVHFLKWFANHKIYKKTLTALYVLLGFLAQVYVIKTPKPWIFAIACFFVYIVFVTAFHFASERRFPFKLTMKATGIALFIIALICISAYLSIYWYNPLGNPKTVYEHFNYDFKDLNGLHTNEIITIMNEPVKIDERYYIDSTGYDFICYHIPDTTTTSLVCEYLFNNTSFIIEKILGKYQNGDIQPSQEPFDLSNKSSNPRYIYIYHEQHLSDSDKNWIDSVFRSSNLGIYSFYYLKDKDSFKNEK